MPPKKKGIKMDLGSFLTDESLGSVDWADDVDLPTAPQQRDSRGYSTSSYGGREPSGPVTFPTRPPYTAFIGNLSFEITDRDIETFFRELRIKTIRLVRDHDTDQPKGYGYCEFDDVDSLRAAVAMNGESVQGRNIRIDVSEPKVRPGYDGDREGRPPRSDFEVPDVWRRVEPVRRASPSGSDRSFGRGGFGGDRGGSGIQDRRFSRGDSFSDRDRGGYGDRGFGGGFGGDRGSFSDRDRWGGGGDRTGGYGGDRGSFGGDRGSFGGDRGSFGGSSDGGQRKRLELKPRTDSVRSPTSPTPETQSPAVETPTGALPSPSISEKSERSSAPKSNPFGAAKPRDEGEFQRRFEERQKAKEAELKKKEEEAKAKLAAELEEKRRLAEEAATKKAEEEVERRRKEEERKKEEADRAERAREAKEAQDTKAKEVKAAAAAPAREANGPTGGDGRGGRGGSNAGRGRGAYTRTGSFGGNAPAVPEGGGGSWRRADAAPSVPAEGGGGRGVDHHPRGGDHSRGTAERRGSWGPRGGRGGGRGDYQNSAPRAAPAPAPAAPHVTKILEKPAAEPKKNLFDLLSEEALWETGRQRAADTDIVAARRSSHLGRTGAGDAGVEMESPFDVPVRPDLDNIEQLRSLAIEDAGELPVDDTAAPLAASELPPDLVVPSSAASAISSSSSSLDDLDLHHHVSPSPLLFPTIATGVSAVAHTARVGIAAATAVSELALSSARWGTAMTLGVGRSIIVGALSSARILNRTEAAAANVAHLHAAIDAADVSTSSAGANTSGTLIRKPEPLWLFHQALDTYTDYSVGAVNHVFSLAELFTCATWHLARSSVRFTLRAAQETVQIFDGIFGSTETSRAISSLVQLIRDEMNELNDGQGSLPGNGIIGKTFGTIVLMGSVTKALTAFACLQVMTARRTLQGRKLTRLYEGLVSLDGNGLRAGPPMNLDPSLSLRSPTANDFPKLIEGASIYGGSAFDGMSDEGGPQTPVNGHKEEVFLRWHRDGSTEELTIDLEERHNTRTGFGLDGDPSESMLTLDDARSFIEEAQQHLGTEEVHVIDDASSFIEEASLNSPRGSLMPTLEVSYDGVLNSPTGSHASSRDEDGDHGIMFKTSRSLHHPDTHGIVQQSTVTVAGRMSRDRSYASITGSIASRIAPEDRDFLNRVSRDFSGRDLVELQRALSQSVSHKSFVALPTTSATTSRSATPTPASIGAHFATANSSARTASTYRPPIDGNAPAPEANVNILDGLADHTFDTSRVSTKFEKADRTTTTTITPSPSPPATTNRGWGGMFFLPRKMSKPAEVDSESVNSFVTANSSVSESQHVSLADGTASTAPAPRKSSFTSRVGGILQGMLSSGKRTATPASSGSSGSGQIGHALSAKKAKGGMVTMFDQTSTVEKTADGETRRTATIHMNDRQLSQIKGSPNLEPSLLVPAEGSPKLKPEDTRFELASVVPSPPLTPKPAPSKLITQKSEHVIPATSSSSGGEKSKEFSKLDFLSRPEVATTRRELAVLSPPSPTSSVPSSLVTPPSSASGSATDYRRRAGPRIVTRRRERELESSGTSSVGSDYGRSGPWPLVNLLRNLERYARFATAAYGRELMILLGVGKLREIHTDDPLIHTNHYAFSIHTGIPLNDILHSSFTPTVPMPVNPTAVPTSPKMEPLIHYVVLDRAARAVVLSLRGTLGLSDVLTDMRFDYADFRGGRVHAGMLRSAAMMFRKGTVVHMAVERALNDNPGYGLVLTGHSLGGGVAALMALEWSVETGSAISRTPFVTSRSSGLPPNRPIHCYSYGSPCVGTHDLSLAARGLVSTLVNGDDMVPTMSLGLVRDLKVIIMHLLDPSNKGLSERIISRTLGLQRETAGPADPATSAAAAGASASTSAGATAGGADGLSGLDAPHSWDDDYFWSIITKLRASMRNERLFPVGTTYWMESAKTETRHAPGGAGGAPGVATKTTSRVVLQRCDDVREMFSEPRFSSRVMSDHFPRAYEDSLDALVMAVFGKQ